MAAIDNMDNEGGLDEYLGVLLNQGIERQASDIHIEPTESADYRIRMRIDGVLHESAACPSALAARLLVGLKIMARLDIAERRLPQDGQFAFGPPEKACSFRLSTLPTLRGEKIVLRLLRGYREGLCLEQLGMPPAVRQPFLHLLRQPQGLIILSGPTGSGKTMTLYAALNALRRERLNICSVEDPVEIPLPGITQCQVNPKARLDFPVLLRALLRQDPDVIMVGEIRDRDTATIAIHAAQTGHLVLATLHTSCAGDVWQRFHHLGVSVGQVRPVLLLVMAQRLVRRLCGACRRAAQDFRTGTEARSEADSGAAPHLPAGLSLRRHWRAGGCEQCHQGYAGRHGLFHLLPGRSPTLLMAATGTRPHAAEGLWRSGLALVEQGVTTLEELVRVLGEPV